MATLPQTPPDSAHDLPGLIGQLCTASSDPLTRDLAQLLSGWIRDDAPVADLTEIVEHRLRDWPAESEADRPERQSAQRRVCACWADFRTQAIEPLGGMTMNERLYRFGLDTRFEACRNDAERLVIYHKLHASPSAPAR